MSFLDPTGEADDQTSDAEVTCALSGSWRSSASLNTGGLQRPFPLGDASRFCRRNWKSWHSDNASTQWGWIQTVVRFLNKMALVLQSQMGDLETVSTARHGGWGPENSIMSPWMLVYTFYSLTDTHTLAGVY